MKIPQMGDPVVLRSVGALAVVGFMLVHLQDWFREITPAFSVGFALLVVVGLLLASRAGGQGKESPEAARIVAGSRIGGAVVVLLLLGLHLMAGRHTPVVLAVAGGGAALVAAAGLIYGRGAGRPAVAVAAAAFLLVLATPLQYQSLALLAPRDTFLWLVVVGSFLFLASASLARLPVRAMVLGAVIAGVLLRYHGIAHHMLFSLHRDMLPLVQYACGAALEGRNPYAILYWANHDLPLTSLPVMWPSYLPAVWLGIDLRWTSILATVLIAVMVMRWGARRDLHGGLLGRASSVGDLARRVVELFRPGAREAPGEIAFGAIAAVFMLQPEVLWNSLFGEPIVYWFWLVLLLSCVRSGNRIGAAAVLGILLATRHFAVLIVPFAALWFVLSGKGVKKGILLLCVSCAIGCVIVMPFYASNPDAFLYGTYDWLVSYGAAHRMWWDDQIGFIQFFYSAEREAMLPFVQAAGTAAGLAAAVYLSVRSRVSLDRAVWIPMAGVYAWVILLNPMIWKSFLFPVMLLVAFGAVLEAGRARARAPSPLLARILEPRVYVPVLVALGAVMAWSGLVLVRGLVKHRNLDDLKPIVHMVNARYLSRGDLLVDWSVVQAGHVPERSLFLDVTLPPDVKMVQRMRSEDLTGYERIVLFDGSSRFDPTIDFPDLTRVTSRNLGRASVHVFRPPHKMSGSAWKLSANQEAIIDVMLMGEMPPSFRAEKRDEFWMFPIEHQRSNLRPVNMLAGGVQFPAVGVHPAQDMTLHIEIMIPHAGQMVLVTAHSDFVVRALQPPIRIDVLPDGDAEHGTTVLSPSAAGRYFWGLGHQECSKIVLELSTEQAVMRAFAIDLYVDPD
ncbi:MAG: hypothetical protein JRG91_05480 [Deltaproteobacteria bacterium]|nr:hypothetical protein [Deltaproteobacteria bacterium]